MSIFELYLAGISVSCTCLMLWFMPRTPIHLFYLLRRLGYTPAGGWPCEAEKMLYWTKNDWLNWSSISLPGFWAELLNCPYCLSTHISFWTAAFFVVVLGAPWYFLIIGTFGWGGPACLLLKKLQEK